VGVALIVVFFGPFLGALLYAALFQRDQVRFYREVFKQNPVPNNSEWLRYTGSGKNW